MYNVELPKQLFKRFENCRYNVRIINNCAKCAAAIVEYSNKMSYKIEYVKPFDNKYVNERREESLEFWVPTDRSTWQSIEVPEELNFVVAKLKELCETSDYERQEIEEETRQIICSFNEQFYS